MVLVILRIALLTRQECLLLGELGDELFDRRLHGVLFRHGVLVKRRLKEEEEEDETKWSRAWNLS